MKNRESKSTERSIDRQILELFRERSGFVSGAELSAILKVSRTAVWKHIKTLRSQGYGITARHSSGYRLVSAPDVLTPAAVTAGLTAKILGCRIICLPETGSTNSEAYRLAEEGAAEGTVIIADSQSKGKGRLGRSWLSPAGVNLYCSLILRPPILPVDAFKFTFLSAVAVARAIESSVSIPPLIKWPNDILLNGKKVAGLLNEMSAETERVNFVILGIGVNLNMRPEQFPGDLRYPATSLAIESGLEISRLSFVRNLLESLDSLYTDYLCNGYGPVRDEWVARCGMIGSRVSVSVASEQIEGVATGIDDSGALLVKTATGVISRVLAGDVEIL
ncbi:bifunctional ligase/repressor BirA [Geobacter sp. OR-1]|uniref:biotin--[acetyl-CoA-carboxylase] ligase n=1 Tax=Geobacter sp. OR-1 TaxID=1266765 RepID=UPI00054393B3|nr:biotin--[acetyl-CoA-carboxylase] ligase [Geobacter sp. OR-1]GAM11600.1 bifunctional ligase/repressor BirA [Geobacter sp. OR-1]